VHDLLDEYKVGDKDYQDYQSYTGLTDKHTKEVA